VHLFVADNGFNGATNRRVYTTTDGGVHVADDIRTATRTTGWRALQNSYRATQFYGAAGDGASRRIVGGTQDNGTLRLEATASNAALTFGGDGGFCAIDWTNPLYLYGEYINLQIHRSTNGGASASYIYTGIADAGTDANFIAPFILDPNNAQRMLAGGRRLWRSNNVRAATPTWTSIKPDHGDVISAIAVARGNADVAWVGHNDGKLYKTSNATAAAPTWTAIDDNGAANPLPSRYLTRIVIDPADANRVYVCFGGFAGDNIWRSGNAGATWIDITGTGIGSLPSAPVRGLARHPTRAGLLYAGTEVGLFTSENDGATWSLVNQGPNDTSIDEVVFLHNSTTLLVATHGRGLWTSDIALPSAVAFGTPCTGSFGPHLLNADPALPPRIGEPLTLIASGMPNGSVATFLLGASATTWSGTLLPLGLGFLNMTGCSLWNSIDVSISVPTSAFSARLPLTLPASQGLLGSHVFVTALAVDPTANAAGLTTSNGLDCTVGN
jgi:hypothetical protein